MLLDEPGGPGEALRVLLVDDEPLFRRGLQLVLRAVTGVEVVGEAADGEEALEKVRELVPDVVLMEVRMPVMNGIEAARRIRSEVPSTRILMLTTSDDEGDLFEAVKAGANGYLLKEVTIEEVAEAIRAVGRGHSLISPSMASKLLDEFTTLAQRAEGGLDWPLRPSRGGRWRSFAWWLGASVTDTSPPTCPSRRKRSRTTCATSWRSCTCTTAWRQWRTP